MHQTPNVGIVASEFMTKQLVTLSPGTDALEACSILVKHRISGAPVVGDAKVYLGVFSEKSMMKLLVDAAMESIPSGTVEFYMNRDRGRTIQKDTSFLTIVHMFLHTPYRRLPVLDGPILVGQVSRRDVLRKALEITQPASPVHGRSLLYLSALLDLQAAPME